MVNPSKHARSSVRLALMRNDLESRGHKLPPRAPSKHIAPYPMVTVGGEQWPTFVVIRGEDMIAGKLSITQLALAVDAETAATVLDYVDAREGGLAAPDFAAGVTT